MNSIIGWLLVNAFLIGLALIGAGLFFVLFSAVQSVGLTGDTLKFFGMLAAVGAIFGTYYIGKYLYGLIERRRSRSTIPLP